MVTVDHTEDSDDNERTNERNWRKPTPAERSGDRIV